MSGVRLGIWCAIAGAPGCFVGEATLGSACVDDLDCGGDQRCSHEVCGACGDGVPQRGELCLVGAAGASTPAGAAADLVPVDLDRDGDVDLLTRGEQGRPELWEGARDGTWTVRAQVAVGGQRGAVRAAALDDDAVIDLVVVDEDDASLHLGYGDQDGGWSFVSVALEQAPRDLAVGRADWAGGAWVAWVDARGLWQARVDAQAGLGAVVSLRSGADLWVADPVALDEDDALDLVVADGSERTVTAWLGDGAGGLVQGQAVALQGRALEVITVDVDGDGDADVLVPDEDGGVTVILSDGAGGLVVTARPVVPGAARWATVGDLDRDGDLDLIVVAEHERPVWVVRARAGRYPDPIGLEVVDGAVGAVLAVDADRDGLTELLLGPREGVAALRVVEVDP